jgi:hypothetical protein
MQHRQRITAEARDKFHLFGSRSKDKPEYEAWCMRRADEAIGQLEGLLEFANTYELKD